MNTFRDFFRLILLFTFFSSSIIHADESTLRLFVWDGYKPEKYVKEFEKEIEKKYGRKVIMEFTLTNGPEDFFDMIRSKKCDVATITHHMIKDERFSYISKKLIIPPDLKNIPNYKNLLPDFKKSPFFRDGDKVYAIPLTSGAYGLAYNTKYFTEAPKSWNLLWDSKVINNYTLAANEYLYNVGTTALAMGYPKDSITDYDKLNNDTFKKRLRALAINAKDYWIGVDTPEDLDGLHCAMSWGDSLPALRSQGKNWQMANPKEGILWWIDAHVLTWTLKDKPFLKKVAEEWINKTLSVSFQVDHLIHDLCSYPVINNISKFLTDEERERVLPDDTGAFMQKRILLSTLSERDRNGLKLLWDEAMKSVKVKKGNK